MKRVEEEQIRECYELLSFLQQIKTNQQKHINMDKKYQITGYQIVNHDGSRDSVRLASPINTDDVEHDRKRLTEKHNCKCINLTYISFES